MPAVLQSMSRTRMPAVSRVPIPRTVIMAQGRMMQRAKYGNPAQASGYDSCMRMADIKSLESSLKTMLSL